MKYLEFATHINAGVFYGEYRTCGSKINRRTEESAVEQAARESLRLKKDMEAYPCAFCDGWHIGRTMTQEERDLFTPKVGGSFDAMVEKHG